MVITSNLKIRENLQGTHTDETGRKQLVSCSVRHYICMKLAFRSQMWGKQNASIEFQATSLVCLEIILGILLFYINH